LVKYSLRYFNLFYMLKYFMVEPDYQEQLSNYKNSVFEVCKKEISSNQKLGCHYDLYKMYEFFLLSNDSKNSNADEILYVQNIFLKNLNISKNENNPPFDLKEEIENFHNLIRISPISISKMDFHNFVKILLEFIAKNDFKNFSFGDLISIPILIELAEKNMGVKFASNSEIVEKLNKYIIRNLENFIILSPPFDLVVNSKIYLILFRNEIEGGMFKKSEFKNLEEMIEKHIANLVYAKDPEKIIVNYILRLEVEFKYGVYRILHVTENENDKKKKNQIENFIRDIKIYSA